MPGSESPRKRGRGSRAAATGQTPKASEKGSEKTAETKSPKPAVKETPPSSRPRSSRSRSSQPSAKAGSSTKDNERDIGELCNWFRMHILVTSGGWLGDFIPWISNWTGIWDIFLLVFIWVIGWVAVRESPAISSMILALVFDVTIPLQHQLNPRVRKDHEQHLARYWPIQGFAVAIEVVCFFMVHPYMFTMVVGIKTTLMTGIWLYRRADGTFLVEPVKAKKSSKKGGEERGRNDSGRSTETPEERNERKKRETETPEERKERKKRETETPEQTKARNEEEKKAAAAAAANGQTTPGGTPVVPPDGKASGVATGTNGGATANESDDDDSNNVHLYDIGGDRLDNGIIPHRDGNYFFPRKDGKIHPAYAPQGQVPTQGTPAGQPVDPINPTGQPPRPQNPAQTPAPNQTTAAPPMPPNPPPGPPQPPPSGTHSGPPFGPPGTSLSTPGGPPPIGIKPPGMGAPGANGQPAPRPNFFQRILPGSQYRPKANPAPFQDVYVPPKGSVPLLPDEPHGHVTYADDQWRTVFGDQGINNVLKMLIDTRTSIEQIGWVMFEILFQRDYRTLKAHHKALSEGWRGGERAWLSALKGFRQSTAMPPNWICKNNYWCHNMNMTADAARSCFTYEERKRMYLYWMNFDPFGGGDENAREAAEGEVEDLMDKVWELGKKAYDQKISGAELKTAKDKILEKHPQAYSDNSPWRPSAADVGRFTDFMNSIDPNEGRPESMSKKDRAAAKVAWNAEVRNRIYEYENSTSPEEARRLFGSGFASEARWRIYIPIRAGFKKHIEAMLEKEKDQEKRDEYTAAIKQFAESDSEAAAIAIADKYGFPVWQLCDDSMATFEKHLSTFEIDGKKMGDHDKQKACFELHQAKTPAAASAIAKKYGANSLPMTPAPIGR